MVRLSLSGVKMNLLEFAMYTGRPLPAMKLHWMPSTATGGQSMVIVNPRETEKPSTPATIAERGITCGIATNAERQRRIGG